MTRRAPTVGGLIGGIVGLILAVPPPSSPLTPSRDFDRVGTSSGWPTGPSRWRIACSADWSRRGRPLPTKPRSPRSTSWSHRRPTQTPTRLLHATWAMRPPGRSGIVCQRISKHSRHQSSVFPGAVVARGLTVPAMTGPPVPDRGSVIRRERWRSCRLLFPAHQERPCRGTSMGSTTESMRRPRRSRDERKQQCRASRSNEN
jgi:hypothetical protein